MILIWILIFVLMVLISVQLIRSGPISNPISKPTTLDQCINQIGSDVTPIKGVNYTSAEEYIQSVGYPEGFINQLEFRNHPDQDHLRNQIIQAIGQMRSWAVNQFTTLDDDFINFYSSELKRFPNTKLFLILNRNNPILISRIRSLMNRIIYIPKLIKGKLVGFTTLDHSYIGLVKALLIDNLKSKLVFP